MAEDWRATVRLQGETKAARLLEALNTHEVEEDARRQFGDRVAVSASGDHVFLYADTESAARHARQIVEQLLEAHRMSGEFKLDRWHHDEEEWEDATVPLPTTSQAKQWEHEKLEAQEKAESKATGLAEWELRIELGSHRDARALADRLAQGGLTHIVHRWKFLLIGSEDKDEADALAVRLQSELPAGATIHVEPGSGMVWQGMPRNPFAVFGGLGG